MFFFLIFFICEYYFIYLFYFFLISFFWFFNWNGLFFLIEGFLNFSLVYLSFMVFLTFLMMSENYLVILMSFFLLFISLCFFMVLSILFFFIFFEMSVLPVFFLTLKFGIQIEKLNSVMYLIFYTMVLSYIFIILMLIMMKELLIQMVYFYYYFSFSFCMLFVLIFLMKFPMFFLHFWLPKMHVEASTSASMILASLLLKFGVHGFSRFLESFYYFELWLLFFFGFCGMIVGSLMCLMETDSKSIVAYSSIVHMSFVLMSYLFLISKLNEGCLMMMLGHGFSSLLNFYLVGEIYHSLNSRLIYYYNGMFLSNFFFYLFFFIVNLVSSGLPITLSFVMEFFGYGKMVMFSFLLVGFMFFCFLLNFYYSIYYILMVLKGKSYIFMEFFWELLFINLLLNFIFFNHLFYY